MSHVYEGAPDGRQSSDVDMPTSRFRPRYRALTDDEKALHDQIKAKAEEMDALIDRVVDGRPDGGLNLVNIILARTSLEAAVMWTVKELTA